MPSGEVTLLAGHGGAGKSYIALLIAINVVLGLPFGGLKTKPCPVLFYSAEDGKAVLKHRVRKICIKLGITMADLKGRLHIIDASDIDPTLFIENPTKRLSELKELVQYLGVGLTIIDNGSDVYDNDEIRRAKVRAFMRAVRSSLARPDRAVLLLVHVSKVAAQNKYKGKGGGEDYSGSTAWHNSCRSRLSLTPDKDGSLDLEHLKANHGPKAGPMKLTWDDGVPLVTGSSVFCAINKEEAAEKARLKIEKEMLARKAIVEIMVDFQQRGEPISSSTQGNRTSYHLLKGCKGFPAWLNKAEFDEVMRQMERDNLIVRRTIKTQSRKIREVFELAPIQLDNNNSAPTEAMGVL